MRWCSEDVVMGVDWTDKDAAAAVDGASAVNDGSARNSRSENQSHCKSPTSGTMRRPPFAHTIAPSVELSTPRLRSDAMIHVGNKATALLVVIKKFSLLHQYPKAFPHQIQPPCTEYERTPTYPLIPSTPYTSQQRPSLPSDRPPPHPP